MRLGMDLPTVSKQLWLSSAVAKGVARTLLRGFSVEVGTAGDTVS